MLSRFGFNRRRDIEKALETVKADAAANWRDQWAMADPSDLQAELDAFLPDAMAAAQSMPDLKGMYSARITRAILMGVAGSGTHPTQDFEAALGVPMPKEGPL